MSHRNRISFADFLAAFAILVFLFDPPAKDLKPWDRGYHSPARKVWGVFYRVVVFGLAAVGVWLLVTKGIN